ncbi:MAG TPA: hypothetical protein VM468_10365, partial [Mycoplana sp.]|nr:hypothetical protein [Mycoplana sp.]
QKDVGDGRRILLKLAPAGVDILRTITPDSLAIYDSIEARYGKLRGRRRSIDPQARLPMQRYFISR